MVGRLFIAGSVLLAAAIAVLYTIEVFLGGLPPYIYTR